ncbi:MAG: hypothetical protein KBH94_05895 [Caldisericia bacterium]|jgi:hypothetical protein|nr:hypothetical protein [Caldisericia bacterium]
MTNKNKKFNEFSLEKVYYSSLVEYAVGLAYSSLIENYLINILNINDNVELAGGDKEHSTKPALAITNLSGFQIYNESRTPISIKITNNYTELFTKKKIDNHQNYEFHLLKSNFRTQKTLILGIDIINDIFLIIDVSKFDSTRKVYSYPPYGGKSTFEQNLKEIEYFYFTNETLLEVINFFINS